MKSKLKAGVDAFYFIESSTRSSEIKQYTYHVNSKLEKSVQTVQNSFGLLDNVSHLFMSTFLPVGYPHSVRPEYLTYQMWDSIQGISSYLRCVLTTRSVLSGIGVGSSTVTPLSAALVWVMKDGMGMIGSLTFAYYYSESFEVYTKEWRLFADVLNNIGLTLDLISSLVPSHYFLALTSISVLSKSCCGLVAGATKAKISAHFALTGHLSDVTVKESTQETAIALCGLLLGMILTKLIGTDDTSTWLVFLILLCVHQYANYLLVKVLIFDTLNPQRCYLLTKFSLKHSSSNDGSDSGNAANVFNDSLMWLLAPNAIAKYENFYWPFYLSFKGPQLGAPIGELLETIALLEKAFGSTDRCTLLLKLWIKEDFLISLNRKGRIIVCLRDNCSDANILKAYFLACYIHIKLDFISIHDKDKLMKLCIQFNRLIESVIGEALAWYNNIMNKVLSNGAGWNINDYSAMKPLAYRYTVSNKKLN